jgi:hypothetical protein
VRIRSMRFPPRSLIVSTPALMASEACCTTSCVTRLTRGTTRRPALLIRATAARARLRPVAFLFFAADRLGADFLALEPALFRALFALLLRAEPRFMPDRADFRLADDFFFLVAIGSSPLGKRPG